MKFYIKIIFSLLLSFQLQGQTMTYDNLGRMTNITYTDGTSISYTYDAVGNRTNETVTGAVLPVEWLYFTARPDTENGNKSLLEWATATETNTSHFEIEHSTDGKTFTKIGTQAAAGTSLEEQTYEFTHNEPIIGVNYYRLKQVDLDDKFEYSNIAPVKFEMELPKLSMQLFPNPTTGILNIEVPEIAETPTFQVFDIKGQLMTLDIQPNSGNQWTLNSQNLPVGTYFLQMRQGEQVLNKKFVVAQ